MNSCCENSENLGEPESVPDESGNPREDLIVRICKICGNRHFELTVDPATIGVKIY